METDGIGPRRQRQILLLGAIALTLEVCGVLLGALGAGACVNWGLWWQAAVWMALGGWSLREVIIFGRMLNEHGALLGTVRWSMFQLTRERRVRRWIRRDRKGQA